MNIENIVEKFTSVIISHKIKTITLAIVLVLLATSGVRFLETPAGYRSFVENDQQNYQDILNIEEKYGTIDTLTFELFDNIKFTIFFSFKARFFRSTNSLSVSESMSLIKSLILMSSPSTVVY